MLKLSIQIKQLFFPFLLATTFLNAQIEISGIVKNTSNVVIEFANIVVLDKSDTILAGSISDENGNFSITLSDYDEWEGLQLKISFIGYKDWERNITSKKNMVEVVLEDDRNSLGQVEITAKKKIFERKVDRLIFNIESSAFSSGDMLDALRVTPGLQVQDNGIAMIGRDNLRLMVDGKFIQLTGEDLVNYIRSIPASDIASIEVITTPPAKYEAEGNSGFINIVYKKNKKDNWKNSIYTSYAQRTYPSFYFGNTFNFKKNKFRLYANLGVNKGHKAVESSSDLFYPSFENRSNRRFKNEADFVTGRISLDYNLSEKTTIGLITQHYIIPQGNTDSEVLDIIENNTITERFLTQGSSDQENTIGSYNFHFSHTLDTIGRKISFDADYFDYKRDRTRSFQTDKVTGENTFIENFDAFNDGVQDIDNISFRVDVEYPTKFANIGFGGRISLTDIVSDTKLFNIVNGVSVLDVDNSNVFEFEENIQALYVDFFKKINDKWQVKFGVRLENTDTEGMLVTNSQVNTNSYLYIFPTAYVNYTIKDNSSLNLSYNRRLNRPQYWELNPFRWFRNPNSYSEGNPFLLPSITNNFDFRYGVNQNLTLSASFSTTDDGSGQITILDENDINQIYTRNNYYKSDTYRIAISYNFRKIKWWESYFQSTIFHTDVNVDNIYQDVVNLRSGAGLYFSTNNSFSLGKGVRFDINYWYSAANTAFFEKRDAQSLDFGLRFYLLQKELTCNIKTYDVFRSSNRDIIVFADQIKQVYNDYYDNRYFIVSLQYSFGNKKVRVNSRNFGNDEEKNRVE